MRFDPVRIFAFELREKSVLKNNQQPILKIKDKHIRVIGAIEPQLCQYVMENFNNESIDLQEVIISHILFFIYKCHN